MSRQEEQQQPQFPKLTSSKESWINSSLVSVTQITPTGLDLLYQTTLQMRDLVLNKKGGTDAYPHHILSSVFYEASTRTSCSFQAAMMRLGGKVIHVDAGSSGNSSASKKGESLVDTIQCMQCYTDVTVLRHSVKGTVGSIVSSGKLDKPVINAGDGVGEHPTQALLDLFTIIDELELFSAHDDDKNDDDGDTNNNSVDGMTPSTEPLVVVLVGDLKHGRTVHSLAKLLAQVQKDFLKRPLVLRYCTPIGLEMPQYIKDFVMEYTDADDGSGNANIRQEEFASSGGDDDDDDGKDLLSAMKDANVMYVTRVQKERFETPEAYEAVKGAYVVDTQLMKDAPSKMIVMHPLPRVDEISPDVDSDPRAAYFRQMKNGMFVRMAILSLILG